MELTGTIERVEQQDTNFGPKVSLIIGGRKYSTFINDRTPPELGFAMKNVKAGDAVKVAYVDNPAKNNPSIVYHNIQSVEMVTGEQPSPIPKFKEYIQAQSGLPLDIKGKLINTCIMASANISSDTISKGEPYSPNLSIHVCSLYYAWGEARWNDIPVGGVPDKEIDEDPPQDNASDPTVTTPF